MRIAIVGGTGKEGRGLAMRWARAGHQVAVGSRDAERAREKAAELSALGFGTITGGDNVTVAAEAEVVLLSIPFGAHAQTLRELRGALQGKIVIDITVPLAPPKVLQVHLPPSQSAALETQEILGAGARVVAGLHHISSTQLTDPSIVLDADALVCGDDEAAKNTVIGLIGELGLRGLDAGLLRNSIALESLTPVLLYMNKRYKGHGAGVKIVGLPS
jgi:8-hydroxy-5-deazaflavin:NADPH oxidoreductase